MVLSRTAMWVTVLLLPSNCAGKAGFWTEKQPFLRALGEDPTLLCSGKTKLGKGGREWTQKGRIDQKDL